MTVALEPNERARLRQFLVDHFDLDELKDLAFDLGVDYQLFSHKTKRAFSRKLITYFERRDKLGCLVIEVLKRRPGGDLARLLAKLPVSLPPKKVVVFVSEDILKNVSELLLGEPAMGFKLAKDEVVLIGAVWGESIRLLIGLPEKAADLLIASGIRSLGDGKYRVVSITAFDSLDSASQKAWRLAACDWPPTCRDNVLRPAFSWKDALKAVSDNSAVATESIHQLAQHILEGNWTLSGALQIIVREALEQADDTLIDELNRIVRDLAAQNLTQATVMAAFNCQLARYKGGAIAWGHSNFVLGWLHLQQDELELAGLHYQKALNVFEPLSWAEKTVARIRYDIGEIRERQNDLKAALGKYQQALPLAQKLKISQLESDVRNGLGRVYLAQERVEAALDAFQQALKLSQKSGDKRGQETALGNLGQTYHFLGRLITAEEHYAEAIALSREVGHQAGTGRHLNNLGNVQIELGELDEAEKCFVEALAIARQRHDRRGEQQRLGNLGNLYQAKAKRETDPQQRDKWLIEAEQYHQEAAASARERDDRRGQAIHILNQGNVHSTRKEWDSAKECYEQALDLAESAQGAVDTQWRIHYAWGNLYAARHQDQPAFEHYAAAIEIVENQRNELKIESRTKFWQERAILYKRMVLCCLRRGELWPALLYTERSKSRYLADLLAELAPLAGDTQESIQATLKALPPCTAVVVFNVTKDGTVVCIVADRFETSPPDDGWQQSSDGRIWARRFEDLDRDTLQRLLIEVDDSGQASGGYLVDYYASRAQWIDSTLESASAKIYGALLAPVHCKLARLSVKRVVFMPNLGLSLLPLHACQTEQGYLLDHYEITYAPSFGVLHHLQAQSPSAQPGDGSLFAVSNPTGDLVWAGVEVERISELLPTLRKLDDGSKAPATVKAIVAGAPGHTFVHFACHGKFELRDPLRSRLKLVPPELLTLETILKHLKLPQTQLVVMSACETGLIDPGDLADEHMGLPGGFVLAGAPAVVSTLWAVNDLSTALLMERFYENLLRGDPDEASVPLPPAEALRRAQIWLRDEMTAQNVARRCEAQVKKFQSRKELVPPWLSRAKRRYTRMTRKAPASRPFAHPFYWAAFVLSGTTNNRR